MERCGRQSHNTSLRILTYTFTMSKRYLITAIASILYNATNVAAFSGSQIVRQQQVAFVPRAATPTFHSNPRRKRSARLAISANVEDTSIASSTTLTSKNTADDTYSFIQTELRGAAMKLHTKAQSPKEGEVQEDVTSKEPYITTHADYLSFLIDSQHVYKAMEEIIDQYPILAPFRNTGLERVAPLEKDIAFLMQAYYKLPDRPLVGKPGRDYAQLLHDVAKESIPAFMCHYYNHYFAHTAGGRMIGKQMSALLLDKKTLEFYKVCSLYDNRLLK